ncbi:MAG TPA: aldo/keto reductase [Beijerinckiaceae bacterium]|nr:aldo/keto reductase [Beijerinckiaceae bacterium]
MPLAPLVHANGAAIPAIGLGTWRLEGDACVQVIQWAIEAGYRHIDTAAMYGNEEAVGAGLRACGLPRDEVFVTTKVWPEDLAPGDLERSAEASLRRLRLEAVNLLLIHWPNLRIPLRGTIEALCRVKRRGLARHIGVANFNVRLLEEAVALAGEPLVTNQCEYHPYIDQGPVLAACRGRGLSLTSYCPLGRTAVLSDPVVRKIASAHDRTPAQVILRWHVQQPGVVAIPKSGDRQRLAENISILDFALGDEEMRAISALARAEGRLVSPAWAPAWDT